MAIDGAMFPVHLLFGLINWLWYSMSVGRGAPAAWTGSVLLESLSTHLFSTSSHTICEEKLNLLSP